MSKVTKSIKSKNTSNSSEQGYLHNFKFLVFISTLLVVFFTPYFRGLYFEAEQFITQIILFLIFIVFWVYKWLRNDKSFLKTPIEYAAFGLVLIYFLSSFTAVSQRQAISEFLKYAMYFIVFFILSDLVKTEKEKLIVLWVIVLSALGVSIIGIDSAAGGTFVNILNSIFNTLHLDFEFFGLYVNGRIHSTMQYPNAFASYLLAVFFISMSLIMISSKWRKCFISAISTLLLITFILTISRGAYILFGLAVIMFLFLLPKADKLKGIYNLFTVGVISVGSTIVISNFLFEAAANKALIWPIVLISTLLAFFIRCTDDYAIQILKEINWKIATIGFVVMVILTIVTLGYVFNASVPLEIKHTAEEKNEIKGISKRFVLNSDKNYRLVFNVDAKSINEEAPFVFRVYIKSKNKNGISSNEVVIADEQYNSTKGVEKKGVEFTVPDNSEIVNVLFQSNFSGTSAKFYDAKIYDADSGSVVKNIVLKHRYSLAESILSRFENILVDNSFLDRTTFLKDGFMIFKDWWLVGAGGGAWSILYFKYQSYLYWSTQTHNYLLQVLVETGLIGISILTLLLISIAKSFIKSYRKDNDENNNTRILDVGLFTSIVFLFFHAAFDFDFSLSAIYLLCWILVALLNVSDRNNLIREEPYMKKKNNKNLKFILSAKYFKDIYKRGLNVHPVCMIISTIAVIIYPIIFYGANIYADKALNCYKDNNLDGAIAYMDKATTLDYLNTKYVMGYVPISSRTDIKTGYIDLVIKKFEISGQTSNSTDKAILNSYATKVQKLVRKVERQAKYDSDMALNLGIYYLNTSEKLKGLDYIAKSVDLKPLVPTQWQYKANANYVVAMNYFKQGEHEKFHECIKNMLKIIGEAKMINSSNLKPFIFNGATQVYFEKAYYLKNNNEEGNEITVENLVFQSIFEMDVNGDNIPDQWYVSDNMTVNIDSEKGVLTLKREDINKSAYISTRNLIFEPEKEYLIEVELSNEHNIKSIPYRVRGVMKQSEQLFLKGNVYTANIVIPKEIGENNKLDLYINDEYQIKSVRIFRR